MDIATAAPSLCADEQPSLTTAPLDAQATAAELYEQVVLWYHQCLLSDAGIPAHEFLLSRALRHDRLLEHFEIGYADRALPNTLPAPTLKAGRLIRDRLQQLGVYRPSGHAHYSGSVTLPIRTVTGQIVDIYGRKASRHLAAGTTLHSYLPSDRRPSDPGPGVVNGQLLGTAPTLVLTDSPLNALALFVAGLEHVTCLVHEQRLTDELAALLRERQIGRVILAFRNTDIGITASESTAERLRAHGLSVTATQLPGGLDAADVLQKHGREQLAALVLAAQERQVMVVAGQVAVPVAAATTTDQSISALEQSATTATPSATSTMDDIQLAYDDRHYRVRGLAENHSPLRLKVNLKVTRDGLLHVNLLDLYSATQRRAFMREASSELLVPEELIKVDLGRILQRLEELQAQQLQARLAPVATSPAVTVSDTDRELALGLLRDPQLTDRIGHDLTTLGLVGEEANKLICYLACVSRKLPRPLAVLVQSSAGAGKSSLMDAVLSLMPEEEQVRYSAMTGQSLYYMGSGAGGAQRLRHKILAVAEEGGVAEASYALKLLQSDGRLKIASAGKDDTTGRHTTQDYEVEGPVMMFLTTTREQPDPELHSRCLTVRVNESPAQTAAIQALQRAEYSAGVAQLAAERQAIRHLHTNAQRLLETYRVIIPQAESLTFRQDQIRMRRDHAKYLTLIAASALLHQYQREILTDAAGGQQLVATDRDVELAGWLMAETMGQSLEALLPQTRQLLAQIEQYVAERVVAAERSGQRLQRSQVRFKQRELRESLGWGDFQLREHLARLVELEFVLVYRTGRGNERHYELLYESASHRPLQVVPLQ